MRNTQNASRQTETPCLYATTPLRRQGRRYHIRNIYLLFATVTFQAREQVQKEKHLVLIQAISNSEITHVVNTWLYRDGNI
jgi:hypothetical protein